MVYLIRKLTNFFFRKNDIKPSHPDPLGKPKDAEQEISTSEAPNEPIDILKIAQEDPIIKPQSIYEIHGFFLNWWRDIDNYSRLEPREDSDEDPQNLFEANALYDLDFSEHDSDVTFIKPGEWLIGMSLEFTKSIKKVDRKLKGRILDAITNLSIEPDRSQGKTIKPLSANLKGFWSCKIGQSHRLIYKPDSERKTVVLIAYMPRESDYKPHRI